MRIYDIHGETLDVEASHARDTDTGVEGAMDVDVDILMGGYVVASGEVTLVRRQGEWLPYGGDADHWVSSDLLAWLRERLDDEAMRDTLGEIATAAAAQIERL